MQPVVIEEILGTSTKQVFYTHCLIDPFNGLPMPILLSPVTERTIETQ
jgi:hypothetical protein